MADLRVVGTDADHLLLVDDQGGGHRVAIDGVRSALRDAARVGTSRLTPREIQDRLRGGASVDQVAQVAGVSIERIRRWEGPVLAERAYALERALQTRYVRPPDGSVSGLLGRLVEQRLTLVGIAGDWDAHRGVDGEWIITVRHQYATAQWALEGSTLTALDPHAESLGWREPPRPVESIHSRSNRGRPQLPSWDSIMAQAPPPNAFPT